MTDKQEGILWRIARLHPGPMWLLLLVAMILLSVLIGVFEALDSLLAIPVALLAHALVLLAYPLFVITFLSGGSVAPSSGAVKRTAVAFCLAVASAAILSTFRYLTLSGVADLPDGLERSLVAFVLLFFAAWFYLGFSASAHLLQAEKGADYGLIQVFGTFLLFFYLPFFGVYFLHRRIRRLVRDFESGDPIIVNLPLEALKTERQASGHLSLLLTERIGWEDFERYAEELLRRLDGLVAEKGSAADMHIWNVEIETLPFRLVYDDFPNGVTLESESYAGDMLLSKLHRKLLQSGETGKETGPPRSEAARVSEQTGEA